MFQSSGRVHWLSGAMCKRWRANRSALNYHHRRIMISFRRNKIDYQLSKEFFFVLEGGGEDYETVRLVYLTF